MSTACDDGGDVSVANAADGDADPDGGVTIIDEMCLSVKWIGVGSERDAIICRDV